MTQIAQTLAQGAQDVGIVLSMLTFAFIAYFPARLEKTRSVQVIVAVGTIVVLGAAVLLKHATGDGDLLFAAVPWTVGYVIGWVRRGFAPPATA